MKINEWTGTSRNNGQVLGIVHQGKIISRLLKAILVLFPLFCLCTRTTGQSNVALNKNYTLSAAPNYDLASTDVGKGLLTDGTMTSGYYWTSKTTYGWTNVKRLTIEIDLEKPTVIKDVIYNTARGSSAGVYFPANIYVFTSLDKQKYAYSGDAAVDNGNTEGPYLIKSFTLSNVNSVARYVKLVVIAKGAFIFCDEIKVTPGTVKKSQSRSFSNENVDVNSVVDSLQNIGLNQIKMTEQIKRLGVLNSNQDNVTSKLKAGVSLESLLKTAQVNRLSILNQKFGNSFVLDKVGPWGNINYPYQPKATSAPYYISTVVNGAQYGAFILTNLSNNNRLFSCEIEDNVSGVARMEFFRVPSVSTGKSFLEIPDPLIPQNGNFKLGAGQSEMFIFKVTGLKVGTVRSKIKVTSAGIAKELAVETQIANVKFDLGNFSLSANNWAYMTYPLIIDRQQAVVQDLFSHHINTMVIPPNVIPLIGEDGFNSYQNYLRVCGNPKHIMLFMDFTSKQYKKVNSNYGFMSSSWKAKFKDWYQKILSNSLQAGFKESQIYLYPYDEIKNQNVDDYYEFLSWVKTEIPSLKTFATLTNASSITKLTPLITISQLTGSTNWQTRLPVNSGNQLWYYEAEPNSQELSPYSYYRLMAWNAFYNGFRGVGFWNYADYRDGLKNKVQLKGFDGFNAINYSVIYNGEGQQIISSRRWEAFRLGIEDFQLLEMYSKKVGFEKAKKMTGIVLSDMKNNNLADSVRNQIIKQL